MMTLATIAIGTLRTILASKNEITPVTRTTNIISPITGMGFRPLPSVEMKRTLMPVPAIMSAPSTKALVGGAIRAINFKSGKLFMVETASVNMQPPVYIFKHKKNPPARVAAK